MPHRRRLIFVLIALTVLFSLGQLVRAQTAPRLYLPFLVDSRPTATATLPPTGLLQNGHFEQGQAFWFSGNGQYITSTLPRPARSGRFAFLVSQAAGSVTLGFARHDAITLPTVPHELRFYYQIISSATVCDDPLLDSKIEVWIITDTTIDDTFAIPVCAQTATSAWQQATINLSAFVGQSVRIELRGSLVQDAGVILIDDASIEPT